MATHTTPTPIPMDVKAAVETCVARLRECSSNPDAIESKLAARKHIRGLYSLLGDPTRDDFPEIFETSGAYGFTRRPGYTTGICVYNISDFWQKPVDYSIQRPSKTKQRIVHRYYDARWDVAVQAYNVICTKLMQHPRFPDIAVRFYSSRDCARYEYLIKGDDDNIF